jgi:hypothetical protein
MKLINIYKAPLILALLSTFFTGCATIVNGTRQSLNVSSEPNNAEVWLDRSYMGNTPVVVNMTRKDSHYILIKLDGYHPYELKFSKELSGWVFGNIAFGGVIGLAVDAISGGIYVLTPDQIDMASQSNHTSYCKKYEDSFITIVLKPDPSWKKITHLTRQN